MKSKEASLQWRANAFQKLPLGLECLKKLHGEFLDMIRHRQKENRFTVMRKGVLI